METLDKLAVLKTSSMLFAETIEEHNSILLRFFSPEDKVIDVGFGDGTLAASQGWFGTDETTDLSILDLSYYNTLHFSESLGYIPLQDIIWYLDEVKPRKIVIKDFIPSPNQFDTVPYFSDYNFHILYHSLIPILIQRGYEVSTRAFVPNRKRWKELLKACHLKYYPATGITPVICIAKR